MFIPLDEVARAEESSFPDYFLGLLMFSFVYNCMQSPCFRDVVNVFHLLDDADVMALVRSFGALEEYDRGDGKRNRLCMTICDLRFVCFLEILRCMGSFFN